MKKECTDQDFCNGLILGIITTFLVVLFIADFMIRDFKNKYYQELVDRRLGEWKIYEGKPTFKWYSRR